MRLTVERLRQSVSYDPDTGAFAWTHKTGRPEKLMTSLGYFRIRIDGECFLAHRLAWLYVHGRMPKGVIDHIDGNRTNNALANLRDVSIRENVLNVKQARANNVCGLLGASLCRKTGRWLAQIRINGKKTNLGRYESPELAHAAYVAAKRIHHITNTL
jgi:hypothetical protein